VGRGAWVCDGMCLVCGGCAWPLGYFCLSEDYNPFCAPPLLRSSQLPIRTPGRPPPFPSNARPPPALPFKRTDAPPPFPSNVPGRVERAGRKHAVAPRGILAARRQTAGRRRVLWSRASHRLRELRDLRALRRVRIVPARAPRLRRQRPPAPAPLGGRLGRAAGGTVRSVGDEGARKGRQERRGRGRAQTPRHARRGAGRARSGRGVGRTPSRTPSPPARGTRHVRLVRGEGRGVST
jgi:hypothetical protein